jgi:hypothetical protein
MATYWVKSGTGGTDAGTSWANAAESIPGLMAAQAIAGGDTIYVHNTHAYNAGAAITWTLPETGTGLVQVICVDGGDVTGASLVDGTVGNLTTGATEETGGNFGFTVNTATSQAAKLYIFGMTIAVGSGSNQASAIITLGNVFGELELEACNIQSKGTRTGGVLALGGATSHNQIFRNCTFKYGNTAQTTAVGNGRYEFYNCSIDSSGSAPTSFLNVSSARGGIVYCSSCDWSVATNVFTNTVSGPHKVYMNNCVIGTPTTGTHVGYAGASYEFHACTAADGSNGADILSYYLEDYEGVIEDDQTVYLTTGSAQGEQDDGTDTPYSLKMTPSAACAPASPLYTPWIYQLVGSTGAKTVTLKVAHTESAVLTDADIFMEVEYMGEPGATGTQRVANSPQSQLEIDDDANIIAPIYRDIITAGTNRTDTSVAWTGIASEKTHTLTASVTCDEVGYIRCRVGLTKDTTNPVYIDPKIGVA